MDTTSGQDTGVTTVASISGQGTEITSIIGFAAVLVILVAAILAVLFLCTCYGFCKLHSRPAEDAIPATPNHGSRRGMIPLPSPREPPAALNAKKKSPSFQNSPLAVEQVSEPRHLPPTVISRSHSPAQVTKIAESAHLLSLVSHTHQHQGSGGSQQTSAHYISTSRKPNRVATLPPLQLHPLHAEPESIESRHFNAGPVETIATLCIGSSVENLNGPVCESSSSRDCITPGSGDMLKTLHLGQRSASTMACRIADTANHKISPYSTEV